jgi:capsular polysaccharide biosynthesis protein
VEISQYLRVLRQRWWIVALTTAAALVVAGFLAYRGANAYKTTVRVAVSMPMAEDRGSRAMPEPGGLPSRFYDPDYYNWLTSEYLADDLSEIVRSRSFAEDIGAAIGESVDPKSITDVVRTRKTHRVLTITLTASSFDRAQRLGNAIVEVLSTQSGKYLAQLATQRGQIVVIDPAETQRGEGAAAVALDIGLKTLLGLLFGLALVFALYYFDPTVRDAPDAERTLGLPILGEIPSDGARRGAASVAS